MNKRCYVIAGIIFVMLNLALAARAQSALDGFDPNANGYVGVVVVQPDGKMLIGGDFTIVQGIARNRIARLNADGRLDPLFDPNSTGFVSTIAVQADGKVLVGGDFNGANSIGGQARNRIARLDAVTGQADAFNPNADAFVRSFAVQADGQILVGGQFTSIGGQARNRMARLNPDGTADTFNAAVGGFSVDVIVLQADGKILIGGTFSSIGGQPRSHMARLDAATGLVDSFNPNVSPGFFGVIAIAIQADRKILVGGVFSSIGGQPRNHIGRVDGDTGLADSFNPNPDNIIRSIAVQADGRVWVGGDFTSIGGQVRSRIARLDSATGAAESVNPGSSASVDSIAVQADGKIVIVGSFTGVSTEPRNRIARLEADGRIDRTLELSIVPLSGGSVYATAVQPDGKILIAGSFTHIMDVPRSNIARLNTDGTLDSSFNPGVNGPLRSIALQTDGKIIVGGNFSTVAGLPRNNIARVDATIGFPDSFNPNANSTVFALAVQPNGRILVAGSFTTIGGQTRNRMARFDPTSGAVDSFDPNADSTVYSMAVQGDGKILVGGFFLNIGGQTRNYIARLDAGVGSADSFDPSANNAVFSMFLQPDGKIVAGGDLGMIGGQPRGRIARLNSAGTVDPLFDPNANGTIEAIATQADGKILAAGTFTTLSPNGGAAVTRNRIARLNSGGTLDTLFDPNASFEVGSIAVQTDGKILAGGTFTGIGGQTRILFARLSNDTAALQNLSATQTTITWTRGGSSPQLTRATFEVSTDRVNYTMLGSGTATGSNWTLTGLNLPTGQNIYIRARGYYRTGVFNSSESISESVRNAYLTNAPVISGTVTYGNAGSPPVYISNATVTGTGSPNVMTTTAAPGGAAGQYMLTGFGAGSYTVSLSKTTGQNSITSFDAAKIAQHVSGISFLTGNALVAADVSGNGGISSFDAAEISNFVVTAAPAGATGTWRFYTVPNVPFPPGATATSRTYSSIPTSVTGENYTGLLMGEVSGNWSNTGARAVGSRQRQSAEAGDSFADGGVGPEKGTDVIAPRLVTPAAGEVIIPVSVNGIAGKGIIAYEFDLRYDPTVTQPGSSPIELAGTASSKLSVAFNTDEPGLLRVAVYGPTPIDGGDILLNLKFMAIGTPGSVSPLIWERFMLNEGEVRVGTANGQVEIAPAESVQSER